MADLSITKLNTTFYLCYAGYVPSEIDPYNSAHTVVRWNSGSTGSWIRCAFNTGDYDVKNITIQVINCAKRTNNQGRPSVGISTTAQSHPGGCVNPSCEWWAYNETLGSITISGTKYNCYPFTFDVDLKARTTYYLYLFTYGTSTSSQLAWEPLPNPNASNSGTSKIDITFNSKTYNPPPITYTVSLSKGTGISSVSGGGTYENGSSVTISASLNTGYDFINWTGYNTNTSNPYTFTIGQNRSYTANAKLKTYTVTYNKGSYSTGGTSISVTKTHGTNITLEGAIFTRTGYTQDGWSTADGGSKIYELNDKYSNEGDTVLYPHWKINTYIINFISGNNISNPSNIIVAYNSTYGTLPTVSKTGYTFNGWYTSATGGTKITSSTKVTITSNQTLYGQWTANTYTVTFNANGGNTPSFTSKTITYNDTYGNLPTISRTNYVFKGWYTASSEGIQITSSTIVDITANQILYAQWTKDSCIITYKPGTNANGEEVSDEKICGENIILRDSIFTRIGYIQTGWSTSDSGSKIYELNDNYSKDENLILYPVWTAIKYQIQYHANGGMGTINNSVHEYDVEKNLTTNIYTYSGYKFIGWNTKADGTGTSYADKASVKNLTNIQNANIVLYAQWSQTFYTVKFDFNGGSYVSGNYNDMICERDVTYNLPSGTIIYTNRVLLGWSTSKTATIATYTTTFSNIGTIGATVTLYAVWKIKTFTIKYHINNGNATTISQSYTATSTTNAFKTLPSGWSKDGYIATGWSTSSTATSSQYLFGQSFTGDLNVANGDTLNLYTVWIKSQPWTRTVGILYLDNKGTYVYF